MAESDGRAARDGAGGDDTAARRGWMAAFAKAPRGELERAFDGLGALPAYELLRQPEPGLIMVRGRAGGTGAPFNLGEMSVTRCVVRLKDGTTGFSYVAGRDRRHAELAALGDALMQSPRHRGGLDARLVAPLVAAQAARRAHRARQAAATKVDFFTMVRGEDPK